MLREGIAFLAICLSLETNNTVLCCLSRRSHPALSLYTRMLLDVHVRSIFFPSSIAVRVSADLVRPPLLANRNPMKYMCDKYVSLQIPQLALRY